MITTGIVRRIDELGRVVIPKEIRKTMHLKEGEELEVCVEGEDRLVLKKYSAVNNLEKVACEYTGILAKYTGYACYVCDTDAIRFFAGDKKTASGTKITKGLENLLKERKSGYLRSADAVQIAPGREKSDMCYAPICVAGDVIGGVVLASHGKPMSGADKCVKLLEVAADYLAKQSE